MEKVLIEVKVLTEERKPIFENEEKLLKSFENIKLQLQEEEIFGEGNLFVGEKNIYWINKKENEKNYKISFKNILIHATSKYKENINCLYCQLESINEEGKILIQK